LSDTFTSEQLDKLVEKGVTIVVLHSSDWSGPCQRLIESLPAVCAELGYSVPLDGSLAYEELRKGTYYEGSGQNGHVVLIDADSHEGIAKKLNLEHVPSMFYFKDAKDARPHAVRVGLALPHVIKSFFVGPHQKKDYVIYV
jgi:thiol-disulfide isomerase/thioredoxin